jgi:hypothetical protein
MKMQKMKLSDIPEAQWGAFMHALAGAGWTLTKGGGLDHSWALLANGKGARIDMEYDVWMQGAIEITAPDFAEVASALPLTLRPMLGAHAGQAMSGQMDVR